MRKAARAAKEQEIQSQELKKQEQDQIFAKEEADRRAAAVENARRHAYMQSDLVKRFHSKILQLTVLEVVLSNTGT